MDKNADMSSCKEKETCLTTHFQTPVTGHDEFVTLFETVKYR